MGQVGAGGGAGRNTDEEGTGWCAGGAAWRRGRGRPRGAEEAAMGATSSVGGRRYRKQGADEEVPVEEDVLRVKIRPGKVGSM